MAISDEDNRLQIIHNILKVQPFQHPLIHLAVSAKEKDDCAVYNFPGNLSLLVGSDFIRGPGFKLFQEKLLSYFELHESEVPIHPITVKVAAFLQVDPIALAFSASVDFNLMFTISQEQKETLKASFPDFYILGIAVPKSKPSCIVSRDDLRRPIPGTV